MIADARPNRPTAFDTPPPVSRSDQAFKRSMDEFSRRLADRVAQQSKVDPADAAEARRIALEEYERKRKHWLTVAAGVPVAVLLGVGLAWLFPPDNPSDAPPSPSAGMQASAPPLEPKAPSAPVATANAAQAAAPARAPAAVATPAPGQRPSAASVTDTPPAQPSPAAAPSAPAADVAPAIEQIPLSPSEVREVQAKLRSFGFDPGPVDGVAGPMTRAAIVRYQQARGQPETGTVDHDVLEQLRQDPTPPIPQHQLAQRAPRRDPYGAHPPRRRYYSDPFQELGRWLDRMFR